MAKPPAVVAELGRPETAQETADRKAENSRRHRSAQTARNLVGATLASLAIVVFLVIVVVRPNPTPAEPIDYATLAAEAQAGIAEPLIVPALPDTWSANSARVEVRSKVTTWYVGFITPGAEFIAFNQGIDANPSWTSTVLGDAQQTSTETIDGIEWAVYDRRDSENPGNFAYSLATDLEGSSIVIHGTASPEEFDLMAASIAAEVNG
jgi:hypothetical protein